MLLLQMVLSAACLQRYARTAGSLGLLSRSDIAGKGSKGGSPTPSNPSARFPQHLGKRTHRHGASGAVECHNTATVCANSYLLDHLVRTGEQRRRDFDADDFGRLQVDVRTWSPATRADRLASRR